MRAGKKVKDTRFAAMWNKLGSSIISTTNPRAKGHIERLWRTFQDRLLKELHRHKIGTMEGANHYINEIFLPRYNARFASSINCNKNRSISVPNDFDFNRELTTWIGRKVANSCYVSIDNKYYILKRNGQKARIVSIEKLPVYSYLDSSKNLYDDFKYY